MNSVNTITNTTTTTIPWSLSDTTISINSDYATITGTDDWSNSSGSLVLSGPNADITIDGVSLKETLSGIQERLNILSVNPQLESKWTELKELGEQYRKLEAEILEKEQAWRALSGKKSVVK